MTTLSFCRIAALVALGGLTATAAAAQDKPEAKDMALVGYDDLQGRSAYQPTIHEQNGRWIAYIGHHGGTDADPMPLNPLTGKKENNGTSLVDVTDPRHPKYLAPHPRRARHLRAGRRADGARLRRQDLAQGRPGQDLHAAHLRQFRA